ncbi:MAG: VCBS repeat-containing protein [Akkermansia sp.]|nr:VCBS repeat-containing protein [Akkermansia sp.]
MKTFPCIVLSGTLCFMAQAAQSDFSHLTHHWNFDEGRDWHNMSFPYTHAPTVAIDSVSGMPMTIEHPESSWASGRQFSGLRLSPGGMLVDKPLSELCDSCTLSYWLRVPKADAGNVSIIGDQSGMIWGNIRKDGRVALVLRGKELLHSAKDVADDSWHHIAFTRDASSGQLALYIDGKRESQIVGPKGKIFGHYRNIGLLPKSHQASTVFDQLHVFSRPVNEATIAALFENHAPKLYDQEHLVDSRKPTRTGSMVHLYAYDMEIDPMRVVSYGQPAKGKAVSHGDGTFTYTPGPFFDGYDAFPVTVTDGRGGYSTATLSVYDDRTMPRPAAEDYTYAGELPAVPAGVGRQQPFRAPMAVHWQGRTSLLVHANDRLWFYRNESRPGHLQFAAPVEVKQHDGNTLELDGAAIYGKHILLRWHNGKILTGSVEGGSVPSIRIGNPVKDFSLPNRYFVYLDYNQDGRPDLISGDRGGLLVYLNKGTSHAPAFDEPQTVWSGAYNAAPGLGDVNSDGKLDLLHGINWGTMSYWLTNPAGETIISGSEHKSLRLHEAPADNYMRRLDGSHLVIADFDSDGTPDLIMGGNQGGSLGMAAGVSEDSARNNLSLIEKEIYRGHEKEVGKVLEAHNQAGLKRYRSLMLGWIKWAVSRRTPADRKEAYEMLKAHVNRFPFLQRQHLRDAWVKKKDGKVLSYGPMHHVPGIFAMNWVVLDQLMPDSAAQREDVADALGLTGLDRELYLSNGIPLADNNKCTPGQLRSIGDLTRMHPRILFPDDHISVDRNFGDERDAMCYIFQSNKNTFGFDVGNTIHEMDGDMVRAAETCLGGRGSVGGDYFTFVLAHEVCHSLDAYVRSRSNQDLNRRWGDMIVYAATNAGTNDIIGVNEKGWWDFKLTQKKFQERGLWDGKTKWDDTWKAYWKNCSYRGKTFMRGDIDWFLGATQETLATQANHHWARSESRLIGAILRYKLGYKANINEVVHYLDILSAGLNKLHMYHPVGLTRPNRVDFRSEAAWLVRNDKGYITDVIIGPRRYSFQVDDMGRTVDILSHPFEKEISEVARTIQERK